MAPGKKPRTDKNRRRKIWLAAMILVVLFGMAAAWKWTPLANQIDIRKVSAWALGLRNNPARPVVILAAYVIGSLLLVPITVLIIATAIVFGPILGSAYALAGCFLGAGVTYAVGYFLGRDFVRQITGPKWKRVENKIGQTGIIAVETLRLFPVAPITIVNVFSDEYLVSIRDYIHSTICVMDIGLTLVTTFVDQF